MSPLTWKHWSTWDKLGVVAIWIAAIILAVNGAIADSVPLSQRFGWLINNRLWGTAPLIFVAIGTAFILAQSFGLLKRRQSAWYSLPWPPPPRALHTAIQLEFRSNNATPVCLSRHNVAYWVAQLHKIPKVEVETPQGGRVTLLRAAQEWTVTLIFDRPVNYEQLVTDGHDPVPGTMSERSDRHAIIQFAGDLSGKTVSIYAQLPPPPVE